MPFCTQCGNQVEHNDRFCAKCGTPQNANPPRPSGYRSASAAPGSAAGVDQLWNISSRTASLLCYIPMAGWIFAIVVLATERFRGNHLVRFHAFQGLYIFVTWLLIDMVLAPILTLDGLGFPPRALLSALLQIGVYAAWILMLVKVARDEMFKLPILGELAERSVSEQGF